MSTWGRVAGVAGIVGGVLGAAAVGGLTAQRVATRRRRTASGEPAGEPYDSLEPDRSYSVVAQDGVVLHVEEVGPADADLTIVFAHGWTLRSGAWHFQRLGLIGPDFGGEPEAAGHPRARMVFYDQRSHGRSSRAPDGQVTMADLAGDLASVIGTAAPDGPLVLVGHSMGGMALITLAGLRPQLFADRVHGVGLISTAANGLALPGLGRALLSTGNPLLRMVTSAATRYPALLERTRAGTRDAMWLLTKSFGFARQDVPTDVVDYLDEMIASVPVDVIAEFVPPLMGLDAVDALPALADIPTVLVIGDADRVTPPARTQVIAQSLPRAELVVLPQAGHMAVLEAPDEVNRALRAMLWRALDHIRRSGSQEMAQ
jgi:pimeloyl-ACP methyl ester carboxylesterase